jgi:hypothetical protein
MNKIDALKYLSETGPEYINEWTEAGMYHALCKVIHSEEETFTKEYLDELLVEASNN